MSRVVAASGKREAERRCAELEVELRAGRAAPKAGTFGALLDQWIATKARRWSPSTMREHQRIVSRYLGPLRDVDVTRITTQTLDTFYAELAERGGACRRRPACVDYPCEHGGPLSAATVRRIHVVVRAALEQAVKWGQIARNPAAHAETGEVVEHEVTPPSDADVVRLLAAAEQVDERFAVFVLLAVVTGARRGALLALRWSDVDLDAGTVRFSRVVVHGLDGQPVERPATKGKRTAPAVALDPVAVAALEAHHDRQFELALAAGVALPADALLFTDDPLGRRPWRPDNTSRRFRRVVAEAGLTGVRLHDLRHFMATTLLSSGVDLSVVARRGGWARAATLLDVYAHALPDRDRAAADVLGGVIARRDR
ncbi:MAG TPA: tyrosine-type recombinase/integrase [Acidimicrobiales bacterium]|nr:tyrosine-type recombinase/integrase [Acidimicrobiales bacterium]